MCFCMSYNTLCYCMSYNTLCYCMFYNTVCVSVSYNTLFCMSYNKLCYCMSYNTVFVSVCRIILVRLYMISDINVIMSFTADLYDQDAASLQLKVIKYVSISNN